MLLKQDFYFQSLGANRPLHIYLPEGKEGPFPVMYFFDGHNLFRDEDATYGKSWGFLEYLESWEKPMILVGIECGHEGDIRLSEYLPYPSRYGFLRNKEALGERTMEGIVNELKPYIDRTFPVLPFRETTGIGGSSMGGLMSVFALVRYNRYFSKGACISPSLGFVSSRLFREMNETPMSPDTRAFLSWGTYESAKIRNPEQEDTSSWIYRTCRATANKILARGGDARLYCQVGGHHCEADWEKQIPLFMPYLWG